MMENKDRKVLTDDELALVTGGTGSTENKDWSKVPCSQRHTEEECDKPGFSCQWGNGRCTNLKVIIQPWPFS